MGTTYLCLAEEVGFEPTEAFTSHAFQACRFGRSRTLPHNGVTVTKEGAYRSVILTFSTTTGSPAGGEVAVGSCATVARKPGQVLTEAASTRERSCAAGRLAVTSLLMGPAVQDEKCTTSGVLPLPARRVPLGLSFLVCEQ